MTKRNPIIEWIPGIPITDKYGETQNKDNGISSTNEEEYDDDINENVEDLKSIKEETYEDE